MYTEGLQIGNSSYLLQDNNEVVLATINGNKEQMEEYLKVNSDYDKKIKFKGELQQQLSWLHFLDKLSKDINKIALLAILVSISIGIFCSATDAFITAPIAIIGSSAVIKLFMCGTKKKRNEQKKQFSNKIDEIQKELKELKNKRDILKEKIEYSEMEIHEDEIVPVTTVENKKANVKMRVLRLEQSR